MTATIMGLHREPVGAFDAKTVTAAPVPHPVSFGFRLTDQHTTVELLLTLDRQREAGSVA